MSAPRAWRRRCLNDGCEHWLAIDPLAPEGDEERFCSEACARAVRREVLRVERWIAAAEYLAHHPRARRAPASYGVFETR